MQDSHETHERGSPDFYTVREAATFLRVAESTVWRWVDKGLMPAFRMPGRRLRLRKEDVEIAVRPTQQAGDAGPEGASEKPTVPGEAWRQWVTEEHGVDIDMNELVARVKANNDRILAERGGERLPSSVADIRRMREERARRLGDD